MRAEGWCFVASPHLIGLRVSCWVQGSSMYVPRHADMQLQLWMLFLFDTHQENKRRNDIIPRPHRLYLPRDPPSTIYILHLECNVPARALRRADREDQPPPLFPPHALENVLGMPTWILWARCREPPRRKMLYACVSNPNPARQYRRLAVSCTRMPVPWSYIQTVIPDPGV